MATVTQSYFNLLTDKEEDNITDVSSKWTPTPWTVDAKKSKNKNKKQQRADDAAKKKQETKSHPVTMQQAAKPVIYHQRPKQKLRFEGVLMQNNQQKEKAVETELLTLKDYEKGIPEKKQALNAVWKPDVERKVIVDKDFESMKLVNKKKDDNDRVPINSKPKKKERQHSKVKVDDKQKMEKEINGLTKSVGSESEKHPVAGNIGRMVKADTTLSFKDVVLFSDLKNKSLGIRR